MKAHFWNWLREESTGERILKLDGAISDETWYGDEITPKAFREELNSGDGDIVVWLNSPGGDVFAAVEIFNALKAYRGRVTIKIDSLAASSASIVVMAGDVVEISPSGMIMLHNPYSLVEGNSAELKSAANMLDEVKESIINAYKTKTNLSRQKLSEMMDAETWLNAKKAIELGFADRIMFSDENQAMNSAKTFTPRTIKNSLSRILKAKRVDTKAFRRRLDKILGG